MQESTESVVGVAPDHGALLAAQVVALLRADPRVADASATIEPDSDNRTLVLAAIVPAGSWLEPARREAAATQARLAIRTWARVFDGAYVAKEGGPAELGYTGWKGALIGGEPIPRPEMDLWRDQTVARILALRPNHVLEIGCGVGILVEKIAPRCASYRGTDISPEAVTRLKAWTLAHPQLRHVEVAQRAAHELDHLPDGEIDTVILNSVVQYFPDHAYLERVLATVRPKLAPGGHVFLGDVRDVRLLPAFNAAVAAARVTAGETAGSLRRALHERVEKELAIDPHAFAGLPGYAGARPLLRQIRLDNELTRYRYDVVLSTGASAGPAVEEVAWTDESLVPHRWPGDRAIRLRGISNARVAGDLAFLRLLRAAAGGTPIADLVRQASAWRGRGEDPGGLALLAKQRGHRAEAICGDAPDRFDLVLSDPGLRAPDLAPFAGRIETSSDPGLPRLTASLIEELIASITRELPDIASLSLIAVPGLHGGG